MSNSAHTESTVVGCSVKGPDHEENGQPCQDAWMCSQFTGSRFVITVADGLGSKNHSHQGSKLATREAVNTLSEYLSKTETIEPETSREAVRDAMINARNAIAEKASELDQPVSELSTTLLATVAGPSGLAGAAVGDGGIVSNCDGTHDLLVPREMAVVDIEATNMTIPLVSDIWEKSYRFGYCDRFDGVAVFSDGIEEFAWDGLEAVQTEIFDQLFSHFQSMESTKTAQQELYEYLNSDRFRKYSGDDKTLAVGMISSEHEIKDEQTNQRTVLNTMGSSKPPDIDFEGQEVEFESDGCVSLGEVLATRSDGKIYELEGDGAKAKENAVKIFSPQTRFDDDVETKIRSMVAMPPQKPISGAPTFEWPIDVVTTIEQKQFLGYRLSYIDPEEKTNILDWARAREGEQDASASSPDMIQTILEAVPFDLNETKHEDRRHRMGMKLASAVARLHQQGYGVGDLDHSRVVIADDRPFFSRCHQFYTDDEGEADVFNHAAPHPRYASPVQPEAEFEKIKYEDRFGLAVHIFQLLMGGYHPFEAQGSEATEQKFQEMTEQTPFPYRDPQPGLLEPPTDAPSYTSLSAELRAQFERCFVEGKTHPQLRPDASTWVASLKPTNVTPATQIHTDRRSSDDSTPPENDASSFDLNA